MLPRPPRRRVIAMIEALIRWSIQNRLLVLLLSVLLAGLGLHALRQTPVDAIPDLSDVQVIVKTSYAGQPPQLVEDQVTYPLSSALLAVPGARTVRGYSFFGDSYVYVLFDDGTDPYWARARVLEYLSQVAPTLPAQARPQLGPDASGVGWVYLYALVDRSGRHDLSELRSLQDWFLRFELQSLPGVAEVATVGGMVREYQVTANPDKLRAYGVSLSRVESAIRSANRELGASVVEMAEAEYMVHSEGYIDGVEDLATALIETGERGTPLLLGQLAQIGTGPQMRRGVADLNGEGEVLGGIVVMRAGDNAQHTIAGVKQRLAQLEASLPDGVEIVTVYDRSALISRAVHSLWRSLAEELALVALVCAAFLFHLRSSLVAVFSIPLGILAAFIVMRWQGVNANIMSLGGIAIAIGAMIDGAIVMVENLHRHLERSPPSGAAERWSLVARAACEVGPALFFSLLIITVSFLPVFALEAQEGRLFGPLAFTKTCAMAASAALAVTVVPVLMGYCVRGRVRAAAQNPLNRLLLHLYLPLLRRALGFPRLTLALALLLLLPGLWPLTQLGREFMPELDEGDLLYMPTTYAGLSIGKARELLQQTDRLIATVPEVETVFGKAGRAETATDPAPLTMLETFIQLKPRAQWRPGMSMETLRQELDALLRFPGLSNAWVMPIRARIDMLATGIRTPLGIKVAGDDPAELQRIGQRLEQLLGDLPGTVSVYSERVDGGRYLKVDIQRARAARYGLSVAEVQQVVGAAIGGAKVTEAVLGRERYPVNLRYPQTYRDSPEQLAGLPMVTPNGQRIVLGDVAHVYLEEGPPMIKSENGRLNAWTLVDIEDVDLASYVAQAQARVADGLSLPPGYSLSWSGQYEYLERAARKLRAVVPLTLGMIVVLLYLQCRRFSEVVMILATLPLALTGGLWLLYLLDYQLSVAVAVGFIALAGVAVETGVLMLSYLKQSCAPLLAADTDAHAVPEATALREAVLQGAGLRIRPVAMTALSTIAGLLPILFSTGTGAEVVSRIAAPMVGGMLSAALLTLLVLPVLYYLWQVRAHRWSRGGEG